MSGFILSVVWFAVSAFWAGLVLAEDLQALSGVRNWAYQIQGLSGSGALDALEASSYDLLVLEPTRTDWSDDGHDAERHFNTRETVQRLKASPGSTGKNRKLVLAYIDIGQAEDWRWYWTWDGEWSPGGDFPEQWPGFILAPDPDGWGGNYVVKYWDPAWKDILLYGRNTGHHPDRDYVSIVDEVILDGFDGVYLDWVEGFENSSVIEAARIEGRNPQEEMLRLIQEIHDYAGERTEHFYIIQQNASGLVKTHPDAPDYVDGIAQEGIWFEGVATDDWNDPAGYDNVVKPDLTSEYIDNLSVYSGRGVPVLVCEYALFHSSQAYANAAEQGFIGYVTRRSLSRLTTTPPPGLK